jgi:hypothetical protein
MQRRQAPLDGGRLNDRCVSFGVLADTRHDGFQIADLLQQQAGDETVFAGDLVALNKLRT